MSKKFLVVIMCLAMSISIFACSGANATQSDPQVAELQKQLANLQQQVQNQQNQQNQPVQKNQSNQQVQQNNQAQTNQPVQQNNQQVQQNNQSNQNVGQGVQGNVANGLGNQTANISMDQAKQIATQNAGFDVNSVTFIKTMQDYDDFYLKWDIDFVANNMKYEYDISATDGSILKSEREGVAYQGGIDTQTKIGQQGVQGNVSGQQATVNTGGVQTIGQGIDVEQAKQIATQHAGFNTSNVTFTKQKYDFDDGMAKWEIEFVVNTNKYEIEVSATNGTILKYKIESIYND